VEQRQAITRTRKGASRRRKDTTSFTFRRRIGVKQLKRGSYRLTGRATDAAGTTSGAQA